MHCGRFCEAAAKSFSKGLEDSSEGVVLVQHNDHRIVLGLMLVCACMGGYLCTARGWDLQRHAGDFVLAQHNDLRIMFGPMRA